VSIFRHEHLDVDRLVLIVPRRSRKLATRVLKDVAELSPNTVQEVVEVKFDNPWDFEEVFAVLLDVVRDIEHPEDSETWVHITTGTHVAQICLFLLTESRFLPGKLLQTAPPKDNSGRYDVIDLDLARYEGIASRFAALDALATERLKSGIRTRNADFNILIDRIEQVAALSEAPILLMGPTGSGKSELARRIYALKRERSVTGPLVEVNCATLRGDQAMSALFGHRRGAFTGAVSERRGLLAAADGGVLFLDEIGELGLDEQAMLLLAMEQRRFYPVGSDVEVSSEFSLIAGTNRDLNRAVSEGRFREDLLARINLWTFALPALRDRPEDIEPNVDFELDRFATATGRRVGFNTEARARFIRWATGQATWDRNFRDLGAAITRMGTLASAGRIQVQDVEEEIRRLSRSWSPASATSEDLVTRILGVERAASIDRFDRVQLREVLEVCGRSRSLSEAGRELFAVSRTRKRTVNDADRLRKYLARFGIRRADLLGLR